MASVGFSVVVCLQDSSVILGQGERGRTRSQTRKISESGEAAAEEKKPAVKRATTMEQTLKVKPEGWSLLNFGKELGRG